MREISLEEALVLRKLGVPVFADLGPEWFPSLERALPTGRGICNSWMAPPAEGAHPSLFFFVEKGNE